jgi:hypothetical protein
MNRSSFAKGVAAVVAGAVALGAAGVAAAQAQPYGQYGYYGNNPGYDPCQRDANNRGITGALVGGGMGAVIGRSSSACIQAPPPPAPPPPPPAAYNSYGDDGYDRGDRPYRYEGRYDDNGWAYGRHGERFRIAQGRAAADGCTLAESPIYLPDGRIQKRFVRVCMDSDGRYQVVD